MTEVTLKQCNSIKGCGQSLPLDAFWKCPRGKYGRQSNCIQCLRSQSEHLEETCLYIMSCSRIPGEYKIGRSSNPHERAQELQRGHNFEMIIHAIFPNLGHRELDIHMALRHCRVHSGPSREYFKACLIDILNVIAAYSP